MPFVKITIAVLLALIILSLVVSMFTMIRDRENSNKTVKLLPAYLDYEYYLEYTKARVVFAGADVLPELADAARAGRCCQELVVAGGDEQGFTSFEDALAVILTGMGRDGLEGARMVKANGGRVLAQHPHGCTVYGMPKVVIEDGIADRVLPLGRMGPGILNHVQNVRAK